jgi:putative transposase
VEDVTFDGLKLRLLFRRPSMGSVGDAYDNALCESFFATLECELLDRRPFRTQVEARLAVFRFVEGSYNLHRRHSALDRETTQAFTCPPNRGNSMWLSRY